jgi:hypothetical protein
MWGARFWPARFWGLRFWGKAGAAAVGEPVTVRFTRGAYHKTVRFTGYYSNG